MYVLHWAEPSPKAIKAMDAVATTRAWHGETREMLYGAGRVN